MMSALFRIVVKSRSRGGGGASFVGGRQKSKGRFFIRFVEFVKDSSPIGCIGLGLCS